MDMLLTGRRMINSVRWARTLCVTSGGVVYAWGSNLQGQFGVNNTAQQAQALGVHMRRSTVPLRWSEHLCSSDHLCNGSPARIVACGDHHTLVLMQGGEVFACGRGGHGETGNSLLPSLLPDIVRVPDRVPGLHAMALADAGGGRSTCATVRQRG